ncbi:hypothetical protein TNCV_4126901 [Trichonephila clavipes]|uniref:Uncharacterized protein n=1 Tax=Trichonephila clavipes TaxID=2585209 RepID=A0A8X6SX89_TRICX|nr:hypothetical protein TNCV_4126901 [Trichonephila clavipes]
MAFAIITNNVQGLPLKLSSLGLDMDCASHGILFVVCCRVLGDGKDELNAPCGSTTRTKRSIVSKPQGLLQ